MMLEHRLGNTDCKLLIDNPSWLPIPDTHRYCRGICAPAVYIVGVVVTEVLLKSR